MTPIEEGDAIGLMSITEYRQATNANAPAIRIRMALTQADELVKRHHGAPYTVDADNEGVVLRATWRHDRPKRLLQFGRQVQRIDRVAENGYVRESGLYQLLYGRSLDLSGYVYQGYAGGFPSDAFVYDGFGWPTTYGAYNEVTADFLPADDRILRQMMQMDLATMFLQYTGLPNISVGGQSISAAEEIPQIETVVNRIPRPVVLDGLPITIEPVPADS